MKYTLLEMTQQLLYSLDGDEVDSITDTAESMSVAKIIEECYWDLVTQLDLPEHNDFFQLTATSSATPTLMTMPSNVSHLDWIKYDWIATDETDHRYENVSYLPLRQFLDQALNLSSDDDGVVQFNVTINSETFYFKAHDNREPAFYTSYDDYNVLFDAYNSDEDAYLQASKTMCYGSLIPDFTFSDSFTPDLDAKQFSYLLNEAKAQCWSDLKQQINTRAENKSRQNKIDSQKKKQNVGYPHNQNYYNEYPNYGRK
jgi:hypothetical protein